MPPARPVGAVGLSLALLANPLRALSIDLYERPLVVYSGLGTTTAFVMEPALIGEIFHDRTGTYGKNPLDRRIMGRALGNGVLIAPDEDWKWQRRTVAPLFRPGELVGSVPTISAAAQNLLERWRAPDAPDSHDIGDAMVDLTFDIIHATMLAGGDRFDAALVKHAIAEYLGPVTWEIAYDFLGLPGWMPHPGTRRMSRAARTARREVAALVAERRKTGGTGEDLLSRLINAHDDETGIAMSDEQVVDNLLTFLTAGHETTARALTWSLYLTAFFPEWRERLATEIDAVAGEAAITAAHVEQLVLMQRFVKEAMRMFPPAPTISRVTTQAVTLGGERLPEGTRLLVPIYVIHRHRRLWDEPDVFNPDRFAEAAEAARPRYAYMPFGAGPRMCIGASFAMIEATVILATLIRGVRLEIPDGQIPEPVTGITLTPRGPLRLRVRPI